MVTFLTSSFLHYQSMEEYKPTPLDDSNGFCDHLRKYWKENTHFLIFASDPSDEMMKQHVTKDIATAFSLSGFTIKEIRYFDNALIQNYQQEKNCSRATAVQEALKEQLKWADVFYLSGGHAPTENAFMNECHLRTHIHDTSLFDGIFLGLSAGMMNAADEVYLIPELPGESINPDFHRYEKGLGLTNLKTVPHIQHLKHQSLDGQHMIDDIITKDSYTHEFYLIPDGSYFIIKNGITEFFGEGSVIKNGITRPLRAGIVTRDDSSFLENSSYIFQSSFKEAYEYILILNAAKNTVHFLHVSELLLENGIIPVHIDSFLQLNQQISEKLVVSEEKESVISQTTLPVILDELESKGSYVRTIHLDTENGIKADRLSVIPLSHDGEFYLVTFMDITSILDHDWMTDEYSRSGFLARAQNLLMNKKYQQGYSIVYANIQGFKAINNLIGTQRADMVIFTEKDALVNTFQPILLARLEADHFALITKTDSITSEKMEKLSNQHYYEGSKKFPFTISCGIYHITNIEKPVRFMLDQARLAEQSIATKHGIYYAICDEIMSQNFVDQSIFLSELDLALENNEFLPYYQPIVNAHTGKIVSAEALIRWKHSERGMVSPGQFIPIFEKEGSIAKLDSFMIQRVIEFNSQRLKENKPVIPCAVNLSRVDFYDTKLLHMLNDKLKKQDHIQDMLKLEITESAYAVLEPDALTFLDNMKQIGIPILLDDFGSGMSALSTLETYAFDVVKLDMGLTRKIGSNPVVESIIRHTIGMVHDMGAQIIAEGVETKEQLEFLRLAGCDMIQGFYFYKPMPEDEFITLLTL